MYTLNIPATLNAVPVTIEPITGKRIKTDVRIAILTAFEADGCAARVLEELQLVLDTIGFAYCSTQQVGTARIDQDGRRVTISRIIQTTPAVSIEVADAKAAAAILRERCGEPIQTQQALKREAPVIARFSNARGHQRGQLVEVA